MDRNVGSVDGGGIRQRTDGRYGVYDAHGALDGPFGTAEESIAAALKLAHSAGIRMQQPQSRSPIKE